MLEGKNIRDRLLLPHSTPAQIKGGGGGGSYMKTVPRGAQYILSECGPLIRFFPGVTYRKV